MTDGALTTLSNLIGGLSKPLNREQFRLSAAVVLDETEVTLAGAYSRPSICIRNPRYRNKFCMAIDRGVIDSARYNVAMRVRHQCHRIVEVAPLNNQVSARDSRSDISG